MNKKFLLSIIVVVVAIIAALVIFVKPQPTVDTGKITITASAGFWGDIAAQIGGDHVQVTSILDDPAADPHLYESGARDASNITKADVVIANGLGYDDFIDKVLHAAPKDARQYINVADLLKKNKNANPHLWYDLPNVPAVAAEIEARLSKIDPAHAEDYRANLAKFTDSLQPLFDRIGTIRAQFDGAPIAYTERVPQYLLEAASLRIVSPEGFAAAIEEGNEPNPGDQAAMRTLITKKEIRALIYNDQAESPVTQSIRELAAQNNVPVVAVSETAPAGKTYQEWQLAQLDALLAALNNRQ